MATKDHSTESDNGVLLDARTVRGARTNGEADIDVLIVVQDPQSSDLHVRLAALHEDVVSWTGNELQLVEHSEASWTALVRTRNPLVEQVRLDGIALTADANSLLGRRR